MSRPGLWLVIGGLALLLAGCAGTRGPTVRDGPPEQVPPDLDRVPDAQPRTETIRPAGANKPYVLFGRFYQPLPADAPWRESGGASWYGRGFHGRSTASGEAYDMFAMTAAHTTLPIPSFVRVRNPANGREVIVRVNDRGPFHADRIIDLSYTAALKLDVLRGVRPVEIERITPEDIRTGAWRRPGEAVVAAAPLALAPSLPEPAVAQPVMAPAAPEALPLPPRPSAPAAAPLPAVPAPPPMAVAADTGFWLQLGAFRDAAGARQWAEQLAVELSGLVPRLAVFADERLNRVQAGPYTSREAAREAALLLGRRLSLTPVLVQRP